MLILSLNSLYGLYLIGSNDLLSRLARGGARQLKWIPLFIFQIASSQEAAAKLALEGRLASVSCAIWKLEPGGIPGRRGETSSEKRR